MIRGSLARVTSRATPAKGTTTYGYNAVGALTSVDHPASADLTLQYDSLNRLTNLITANTFTNRLERRGEVPTSVTVILLDTINTSFHDQPYAKREIVKFLRQIRPEDRIALIRAHLDERMNRIHDTLTFYRR